jgi:hypothetical protein
MKTASMNKFDYLFLGSLIVDLFFVIAGWDWLVMSVHNQVAMSGGGPDAQVAVAGYLPWFMAFGFAINLVVWTLISVTRIGFLRIILALFVALNTVTFASELLLGGLDDIGLVMTLASGVSTLMTIAALYFVFQPDAGAWLRREA